jgi:hypothetical protein
MYAKCWGYKKWSNGTAKEEWSIGVMEREKMEYWSNGVLE